ncbi:hypothetical protein DN752_15875 [Echinicola strongylocentroti]|uniref:LamG domain-containing protein n=1 Tax=Echinicola strongylocentroti TaxID=1795355 RepID=A0A2Z4IK30_9BACT|nr:heparin lyase I family protein [Echinicola strongylocentroti]AWW31481.1 hypothetical protein DN752_15875 [Echinicola strongylocentroti]
MAIQISPGELGSGIFWVGDESYPAGQYFIYRIQEIVLVNSNELGKTALYGHFSEFVDEQQNPFSSIEDFISYLNKVVFLDEREVSEGNPYDLEYTEGNEIAYDRRRRYGSHTSPLTGSITEDLSDDYLPGQGEGFIFHRASSKPKFPESFVKEHGEYVENQLNVIKYQFINKGFVLYAIMPTTDYEPNDIHDGVVIHYNFNQDPGYRDYIEDKSGYANHGDIVNPDDIEWESTITGFKVNMGNNEDADLRSYITIPFSKSLSFVKERFTVLIEYGKVVKTAGSFFGTYSSGSGNNGFRLGTVADGRMEMGINPETEGSSGRGRSTGTSGSYPTDGSTLQCIITYDGENMRFYTDGKLNKSNDVTDGVNVYNEEMWTLNKLMGSTTSYKSVFSRFAVWNRVLTEEEISSIDVYTLDKEVIDVIKYCPFQDIIENSEMDAEGVSDSWVQRQCYNDPDDIMVSSEYARVGTTGGRFYLRKGLRYQLEKHRTEVLSMSGMETEMSKMKKWMSYSIYFPSDYYIDPSHTIAEVIQQLHVGFSQSPPISIRTELDGFYMQVCYGEFDRNVEEQAELKDTMRKYYRFKGITPGEWHDFILYYELDPTDGIAKLWLNRELVVDHKGPTMYSNDLDYHYSWKVGLYCSQWGAGSLETIPEERLLYYDEVRIANNVAPAYVMFSKMDPEGRRALNGVEYPGHYWERLIE